MLQSNGVSQFKADRPRTKPKLATDLQLLHQESNRDREFEMKVCKMRQRVNVYFKPCQARISPVKI